MNIIRKFLNAARSASSEISHYRNDHITHTVLSNGMHIASQPRLVSNNLEFTMLVRAGSSYDPAGKEGLAHFLEHTLDGPAWKDAFSHRNGHYHLATSSDHILILGVLRKGPGDVGFMLDFIRECLFADVDEGVFQRERNRIRNEINIYNDNPLSYFERLSDYSYHNGRSLRSTLGFRKTLDDISLDDLNGYKKDMFAGKNTFFAVTGLSNHGDFHRLCENSFADMPSEPYTKEAPAEFVPIEYKENRRIVDQLYFKTMFPVLAARKDSGAVEEVAQKYLSDVIRDAFLHTTGLTYETDFSISYSTHKKGVMSITGNILPERAYEVMPLSADILAKASFVPDTHRIEYIKNMVGENINSWPRLYGFIPVSSYHIAHQLFEYGSPITNFTSRKHFQDVRAEDVTSYIRAAVYGGEPSLIAYGDSSLLHARGEFMEMLAEKRKEYEGVSVPPRPSFSP